LKHRSESLRFARTSKPIKPKEKKEKKKAFQINQPGRKSKAFKKKV
jgi:hypothetical protein